MSEDLRATLSCPCEYPSEALFWCYFRYATCPGWQVLFEPIRQNEAGKVAAVLVLAWLDSVVEPYSLSFAPVYKETMCSFFVSCAAGASLESPVLSYSGAIVCASYAP